LDGAIQQDKITPVANMARDDNEEVDTRMDAPYVPTSPEIVKRMLEIAHVRPKDTVFDLGCGDGRILIMAVEESRAKRAVGYEIKKELYKATLSRIEHQGLKDRIRLVNGDMFKADLSEATVITLYLNSSANERLKPKLERETRPGTRVVSHDFEIRGWQPTRKKAFTETQSTFTSFPSFSVARVPKP